MGMMLSKPKRAIRVAVELNGIQYTVLAFANTAQDSFVRAKMACALPLEYFAKKLLAQCRFFDMAANKIFAGVRRIHKRAGTVFLKIEYCTHT